MNNATIILPFYCDSDDRFANLFRTILYLTTTVNCNIILVNQIVQDSDRHINNFFQAYDIDDIELINLDIPAPCYKSKLINEGLKASKTSINIIYDCDVLIPKEQLFLGIELIDKYEYKLVYPYSNPQYNLPKTTEIEANFDFEKLQYEVTPFQIPHNHQQGHHPVIGYSPGFCLIVDKSLDFLIYYNEEFKGWGYEDSEYIYKMAKFGVKMTRIYGPVFHVEHDRTEINHSDNIMNNRKIYEKIISLNNDEFIQYYKDMKY